MPRKVLLSGKLLTKLHVHGLNLNLRGKNLIVNIMFFRLPVYTGVVRTDALEAHQKYSFSYGIPLQCKIWTNYVPI